MSVAGLLQMQKLPTVRKMSPFDTETGFELCTYGVGSDRFTNRATESIPLQTYIILNRFSLYKL